VAELTPFVGRKAAEEICGHFARQRALAEVKVTNKKSESMPIA
jgi:hypothetical protein